MGVITWSAVVFRGCTFFRLFQDIPGCSFFFFLNTQFAFLFLHCTHTLMHSDTPTRTLTHTVASVLRVLQMIFEAETPLRVFITPIRGVFNLFSFQPFCPCFCANLEAAKSTPLCRCVSTGVSCMRQRVTINRPYCPKLCRRLSIGKHASVRVLKVWELYEYRNMALSSIVTVDN